MAATPAATSTATCCSAPLWRVVVAAVVVAAVVAAAVVGAAVVAAVVGATVEVEATTSATARTMIAEVTDLILTPNVNESR